MGIVRVVHRVDGGVSVIYPIKENHTTADFDFAQSRDPNIAGLPFEDIDSSELPPRADRNYWKPKTGGGVEVNIAKQDADKQTKKDKKDNVEQKIGATIEELKEAM